MANLSTMKKIPRPTAPPRADRALLLPYQTFRSGIYIVPGTFHLWDACLEMRGGLHLQELVIGSIEEGGLGGGILGVIGASHFWKQMSVNKKMSS